MWLSHSDYNDWSTLGVLGRLVIGSSLVGWSSRLLSLLPAALCLVASVCCCYLCARMCLSQTHSPQIATSSGARVGRRTDTASGACNQSIHASIWRYNPPSMYHRRAPFLASAHQRTSHLYLGRMSSPPPVVRPVQHLILLGIASTARCQQRRVSNAAQAGRAATGSTSGLTCRSPPFLHRF